MSVAFSFSWPARESAVRALCPGVVCVLVTRGAVLSGTINFILFRVFSSELEEGLRLSLESSSKIICYASSRLVGCV